MDVAMRLEGHRGCINTCSFNPYGDYELTGCDDGCVWLWNIGNRVPTPQVMLAPHKTNVFTTNFLTGSRFISGGNDATVQVIEIANDGSARATRFANHHIRKVLCSFVIDENTFATCSYDHTVRLFDIRTPYRLQESIDLPILTAADMNYNGQDRLGYDLEHYGIRGQDEGGGHEAEVFDVDDSSLLLDFRGRGNSQLYTMDIHPIDRKRFITSGSDGTVRLFDMRMIRQRVAEEHGFSIVQRYGSQRDVTGAAFDEFGLRIAATVLQGNIHVLKTEDFQELQTLPPPPAVPTARLLRRLLGPAEEEEEEVEREPPHGELIELLGHRSETTIKTVNWMGDFVVSGSDDGSVFFYEPEDGQIVNIVKAHEGNVNVVTVHQEKKLLATSGIDEYAILWEPKRLAAVSMRAVAGNVERRLREIVELESYEDCTVM
jgi:WD repeat-containing protein 42A